MKETAIILMTHNRKILDVTVTRNLFIIIYIARIIFFIFNNWNSKRKSVKKQSKIN